MKAWDPTHVQLAQACYSALEMLRRIDARQLPADVQNAISAAAGLLRAGLKARRHAQTNRRERAA